MGQISRPVKKTDFRLYSRMGHIIDTDTKLGEGKGAKLGEGKGVKLGEGKGAKLG
jgi:hypothetical protein